MEGGVAILMFLLVLGGLGVGGFLLFGAGGYARRRQKQVEGGERADIVGDSADGRPTHLRVGDESDATFDVSSKSGPGQRPPMPSE